MQEPGSVKWLREFEKAHPEVLISRPSETHSRLWEVSTPGASCIAFDSMVMMCEALERKYQE